MGNISKASFVQILPVLRQGPARAHERRVCRNPTLASYEKGKAVPETRVFVDVALAPGSSVTLSAKEVAHLRARRIASGSHITLFNGTGTVATGFLRNAGEVDVVNFREDCSLPTSRISAFIGLPKNPGRSDWAVEKLTELGVSSVNFMKTARVVAADPGVKRISRWQRLAIAASKQSLRDNVPSVDYLKSFAETVECVKCADVALMLSATGEPLLSDTCVKVVKSGMEIVILAGPEGGYNENEEAMLLAAGARPVALGKTRLRVETAITIAVGVIKQLEYSETAGTLQVSHSGVTRSGCGR